MLGIVIPTLNCAATLAATLTSLQRLPHVARILVVDSHSDDGTGEVARRHGVDVVPVPRAGMYAAVNEGLRRLDTEWLAYVNGDDLVYAVDRSLEAGAESGADVVYGTVDFIDADGRFIHSWTSAAPSRLLRLYRSACSPLLQQGTIFRRAMFDSLGGFDERWRFVGDADFWLRGLLAGRRFVRVAHPSVAAFRMHAGQLSQRHAAEMKVEYRSMLATHGIAPSAFATMVHASLYRAAHLRQHALRLLRRRDLTGVLRCAGAFDLPGVEQTDRP